MTAILHEAGLVRYWDHDLGPDSLRLGSGETPADAGEHAGKAELRDLTPDCGRALDEQAFCLSPDGSVAVTGWLVLEPTGAAGGAGGLRAELVAIDLETSERRTLLSAADTDFSDPAISPDGRLVVAISSEHDSYDRPGDVTLVSVPLDGDRARVAAAGSGGSSPWPAARVTCFRASTASRSRWPGHRTASRSTSPPTTMAAARSSQSGSAPAR